jgi:hypothetical protein
MTTNRLTWSIAEEEVENEVENVALHYAEGELVRVKAELEEEKLKNADLDSKNADLDSKATHLEIEILFAKTASELASPPPCEDCVVHEENYKRLSGRYDEELDENLQQHHTAAKFKIKPP